MSLPLTLVAALLLLALWLGLVLAGTASGWIHLPLAVGVTLLVRWIALAVPPAAD